MIKHVDYIWNTTSFPTWNKNNIIDTGIFAQDDCEIRVAYQGAGADVDRIVGFSQESTAGDNDDFRIFYYTNGSFDWGSQRVSNLGGFTSNGVDYYITMGNGWLYNNLTSSYIYQGSTSSYNNNCSIRVDVGGQKVKSLQIKNGGVIVFDAFAALDNSNNVVGLYDTVSDTMFTNSSLNLTYGEIISTIEINPESMELPYSGGSSALTITCDEGWTANTNNSWLTLSSTAGTGNSTINVTASENATFQDRLGTITVTDGNDTLTCSITQENQPKLVFIDKFHNEDTLIKKMYLNGALIYQDMFKFIFNVSTSAETFDYTGGTFSATITANRPWSLTAPEWVSASIVSGKSSATVNFTVGENSGETERTGNISIVCNGITKQINITQSAETHVQYVSSVYKSSAEASYLYTIDTGFKTTLDTVMRMKYIGRGVTNGDTLMGYSMNMPNCSSDSTDYRYFCASYYSYKDFNSTRNYSNNYGGVSNGVDYDISFNNNYLYDNINNAIFNTGDTQTYIGSPDATIHVDIGSVKLKEFQITQGGVVVFDGKAAVLDGVVGLYDSVSGQMFTCPNTTMTYDE